MKNQVDLLFLNRRHAGAIVKLACAALLATTAALCATDPDGVTLFSQASVTAAGGFPYKITTAGSYRLASDLFVSNSTAIEIDGPNVTLDLNGFLIQCSSCSGVAGILSKNVGTTILNGYIMGFFGSYINAPPNG